MSTKKYYKFMDKFLKSLRYDEIENDNTSYPQHLIIEAFNKTLSQKERDDCIGKIIEDKFIVEKSTNVYSLTFKGLLFQETGGYRRERIISNRRRIIQSIHLLLSTVGTFLAGIYALFLFSKWFYAHRIVIFDFLFS